jgi:hypothetical protein
MLLQLTKFNCEAGFKAIQSTGLVLKPWFAMTAYVCFTSLVTTACNGVLQVFDANYNGFSTDELFFVHTPNIP